MSHKHARYDTDIKKCPFCGGSFRIIESWYKNKKYMLIHYNAPKDEPCIMNYVNISWTKEWLIWALNRRSAKGR